MTEWLVPAKEGRKAGRTPSVTARARRMDIAHQLRENKERKEGEKQQSPTSSCLEEPQCRAAPALGEPRGASCGLRCFGEVRITGNLRVARGWEHGGSAFVCRSVCACLFVTHAGPHSPSGMRDFQVENRPQRGRSGGGGGGGAGDGGEVGESEDHTR